MESSIRHTRVLLLTLIPLHSYCQFCLQLSNVFVSFQIPFSLTLRVWDLYLLEGEGVMVAMAYNILRMHRRFLSKLQMDEIIEHLQVSPQISNRGRYGISNINQQLTICQQMLKIWCINLFLFLQCCEKNWCIYSIIFVFQSCKWMRILNIFTSVFSSTLGIQTPDTRNQDSLEYQASPVQWRSEFWASPDIVKTYSNSVKPYNVLCSHGESQI